MEKCRRMKRQRCMSKNWIFSWLWKSSKARQQCCRLESFAMKTDIPLNGQKPHLIRNGIRIPCNTENFVPIVLPGLSSSSSGSSSTSKTLSRQESHSSSSSSTSSSSPTLSEIQIREREDRNESDISPVHVSTTVDDRSGRPDDTQANKNQKPNKKESKKEQSESLCSEIPKWLQEFRENWWMMKLQYTKILTPVPCSKERIKIKFYQTRSNAIILYNTLPTCSIPMDIMMETGEIIDEKVYASPRPLPKISCRENWMKELG